MKNRIWDKPMDDDIIREETVMAVKVSQPIGQLFVGECPIVVEDEESARAACEWGCKNVLRQLLEKGLDTEEAMKITKEYGERQFKEMVQALIHHTDEDVKKRASWN